MKLDSFVGRQHELERIASLFREGARLVTLTGPGGMGKTRLAHEAGGDAPFADVSEATTREELVAALATALNIRSTKATPESLASRLRTTLLVVDNFEQLIAESSVLTTMLERAPKLRMIVTSRSRLNVAGEHVVELHPLDEAARLFTERARAVSSSFVPDAAVIDEIVRAVDCIPLAIELCASRVPILGLTQLRDELRAGTLAVTGDALRNAIEGSWRLLDDVSRTTLARCSVFHGTFDLAAVQAVLSVRDRAAALERMQPLHARSLVRAEAGRFRLYESVREFAAEHLENRDAVIALHAAHYVARGSALAAAADGPDARQAREELALEAPNLLAVARTHDELALLALEPLLSERGPLDLYASLLDAAIATTPDPVRLLLARARLDVTRGRFADAHRLFEQARSRGKPSTANYALATSKLAVIGAFLDRPNTKALFDEAFALATALDDARLLGIVLSDRASAASREGDEESALADRERTVAEFARANDAHRRAVALGYLGSSYVATGRFIEGERAAALAVDLLHAQGDTRTEGQVLGFLARARHGLRRFADARASMRAGLVRLRLAGDRWFEGVFEGWLGDIHLEADSASEALEAYERAIPLLDAAGERPYASLFRAAALVARALLDSNTPSEPTLPATAALPPTLSAAIRAHEAHARVVRSTLTEQEARKALDEPTARVSDDARFAIRLLRARLDRPAIETHASFVIGPDARWFERSGAERVNLERHRSIRLLLLRLVEARLASPGVAVARPDLVAAGWPGERIHPGAAVNRLNVSLTRLKRLGLRELLRTRDDGVLIDPEISVTRVHM